MPIHEKPLLNLVQNFVLEVLRNLALEQLEAESVNRSDEHFCHTGQLAQRLPRASDDAFLQLGCGLIGESERHDIARGKRIGATREQVNDTASHHLGLARARAGDELKIAPGVLDRSCLRGCQVHAELLTSGKCVIVTA